MRQLLRRSAVWLVVGAGAVAQTAGEEPGGLAKHQWTIEAIEREL